MNGSQGRIFWVPLSVEQTISIPNRFFLARRWLRLQLDCFPRLFVWGLRRLSRDRVLATSPGVKLVVEGFPRSANSFVRQVLEATQPDDLVIATHIHASAHVRTSIRLGLPTVVLVRSPGDAVVSLVQKIPQLTVSMALGEWIAYYRRVLPYQRRLLFMRFEDVVGDFPGTIRLINRYLNLDLTELPRDADIETKTVDEMRARYDKNRGRERGVIPNFPDPSRSHCKDVLFEEYWDPKLDRRRARADELYRQVLAAARHAR